ncbi:MAG: hypothetical protein IJI33_07270 [Solobacterium sp.]|nr:hypothetical protein [Solobacterium sp.]MBR0213796.1 hypothetical protein [Solobacterium sp.]
MNWMKARLIGCGILLGTAGVKILSSEDAKKVYTHVTAAVMRGYDCVAKTYTTVRENCLDISEDAKNINDRRYAEKEERMIEDARALLEEKEDSGKN